MIKYMMGFLPDRTNAILFPISFWMILEIQVVLSIQHCYMLFGIIFIYYFFPVRLGMCVCVRAYVCIHTEMEGKREYMHLAMLVSKYFLLIMMPFLVFLVEAT